MSKHTEPREHRTTLIRLERTPAEIYADPSGPIWNGTRIVRVTDKADPRERRVIGKGW